MDSVGLEALTRAVGAAVSSGCVQQIRASALAHPATERVDYDGDDITIIARGLGFSIRQTGETVIAVQLFADERRGRVPFAGSWPLQADPTAAQERLIGALPAPLAVDARQRWWRYAIDDARYVSFHFEKGALVRAVIGLRSRWE